MGCVAKGRATSDLLLLYLEFLVLTASLLVHILLYTDEGKGREEYMILA